MIVEGRRRAKHKEIEPEFIQLAKRARIYHGTSVSTQFRIPRGPAWFTDQKVAAAWFAASWLAMRRDPGRPRVIEYELTGSPRVAVFKSEYDLLEFAAAHRWRQERRTPGLYHAAKGMCANMNVDGWLVPRAYLPYDDFEDTGIPGVREPGADDLMLCDPRPFLRRIKSSKVTRGADR